MALGMTGECTKCKKGIEYRQTAPDRSLWVHVDTGLSHSNDPSPHDANTFVRVTGV